MLDIEVLFVHGVYCREYGGRVVYLVDIQKLCPITGSQLRHINWYVL